MSPAPHLSSDQRVSSDQRETDPLASLEERITRAAELVANLRAEKADLQAQLRAAFEDRDSYRQELDELRSERKQVRTRIEKLLGQMDLLSTT
ncbi:MAG TPA: cell division protein ZapB [Bryobacteraceae bacterium]|jgi:FtsZ-binding cell division protein ZapB|nr:cell division protein ZapB [Bryobacteraceae bacterium]